MRRYLVPMPAGKPVLPTERNVSVEPEAGEFDSDSDSDSDPDDPDDPPTPCSASSSSRTDDSCTDADSGGEGASFLKKKKRKKTYTQKFSENWLGSYDWLERSPGNKGFCKICRKTLHGGATHLKRHAETKSHISKTKLLKTTPTVDQPKFHGEKLKRKLLKQQICEAELKLIIFLAEHNLPFNLTEHLPQLIRSLCPYSDIAKGIKCSRTKATQIARDILGPSSLAEVSSQMRKNTFSLIIDETTDVSTKKCLAIVSRHFDSKLQAVRDVFFGLVEVDNATADGLVHTVKKLIAENNIPIMNMIGFAADNAAVMMGNKTGVQTQLKKDVPDLFVMGCVCHSFHLCASAACLKLPHSIEDLAKDIYSYFSNSSKRIDELGECQEFAQTKPHQLLRPSQTRWLSLQAVVNRILEQWPALILFFTGAVLIDNLQAPQTILNALRTTVFRLYFTFLSYVLDLINRLNLEFHSEKPKIHVLASRITQLYRMLLRSFIKREVIDRTALDSLNVSDPHLYKDLKDMFFGVKSEGLIAESNIPRDHLHDFRLRALDFYVELCKQIKTRFKFSDPTLLELANLDPKVVLAGDCQSVPRSISSPLP